VAGGCRSGWGLSGRIGMASGREAVLGARAISDGGARVAADGDGEGGGMLKALIEAAIIIPAAFAFFVGCHKLGMYLAFRDKRKR
jgi:hypothetical protein